MQGITTRRGADELVSSGKVFINGKKAVLGDKVGPKDKVEVKNQKEIKYFYYVYNKPVGIATEDIPDNLKNVGTPVFPIGRLDKGSHGLLILTNDGRITDRMLNPKFDHEKEYVVKVKGKLRNNFKDKMEAGVNIEGYKTKPCKVTIINENTFRVTLTEGKKHQIRRMCVALFQEVEDLKRVRVMNIELGKLPYNSVREIKGAELTSFLNQALRQS